MNWPHILGFKVTETKKGIYFDGHERPDVILDRRRFIDEYEMYCKDAIKIDPETHAIQDMDKPYILISQDEKFIIAMTCRLDTGTMGSLTFLLASHKAGQ